MCGQASSIWMLCSSDFTGTWCGALLSVIGSGGFPSQFPKKKMGMASALFGIGIFIGHHRPTLGGFITENTRGHGFLH